MRKIVGMIVEGGMARIVFADGQVIEAEIAPHAVQIAVTETWLAPGLRSAAEEPIADGSPRSLPRSLPASAEGIPAMAAEGVALLRTPAGSFLELLVSVQGRWHRVLASMEDVARAVAAVDRLPAPPGGARH